MLLLVVVVVVVVLVLLVVGAVGIRRNPSSYGSRSQGPFNFSLGRHTARKALLSEGPEPACRDKRKT